MLNKTEWIRDKLSQGWSEAEAQEVWDKIERRRR